MSLTQLVRRLFGSQLRRNIAVAAVTTLMNVALAVVSYPLYLHFLGYDVYGTWLALSVVINLAQLGGLGMGPAVTKLVAEEWQRGDAQGVGSYVSSALALLVVPSLAVAALVIGFRVQVCQAFELPPPLHQVATNLLPFIACLSAYTIVVQVPTGALSGVGRADLAALSQLIARIVNLAAAALLLLGGAGIYALLISAALGTLVRHASCEVWIRREGPFHWLRPHQVTRGRIMRLLGFGGGVAASSVAQLLLVPMNRILLARYVGVGSLAIFEVAWAGSMQLRNVLSSALQVLVPDFSKSASAGDAGRVRRLRSRAVMLVLVAGVPVYATMFALAGPVLHTWLGASFRDAQEPCLRVMLVGTFFGLLAVPGYYQLLGLGRVRDVLVGHVIQSVANVVAAFAFLRFNYFGPVTICLSVAIGMGVSSVWFMLRARLDEGLDRPRLPPDKAS